MRLSAVVAVFALVLGASATVHAFPMIASWDFEISQPATAGPHSAEGGTNAGPGSPASGNHASGAVVYSSPSGNGSAHSFSSTQWQVGDYYQFCTSTVGFSGVTMNWDHTSSNTGPRDFLVQWNVNGGAYTNATLHTVLANGTPNPAWNTTTFQPAYHQYEDLSSITALDNQNQICIRLTDNSTVSANGGTVGTGGTSRVDNVSIPEPSTLALLGMGVAMLIRKRK